MSRAGQGEGGGESASGTTSPSAAAVFEIISSPTGSFVSLIYWSPKNSTYQQ